MEEFSERQRRELDYHKTHAAKVAEDYRSINYQVIEGTPRKWWNAYWDIWTLLLNIPLKGKKVLVVGCGGGTDAFLFAKLGADVSAFDLSGDMLAHGIRLAAADGLNIAFDEMTAEKLAYADNSFDIVFARDILHHVDIPLTMNEIQRVAKPGGLFVVDEIYSHSITDLIRRSWLVRRAVYPVMQKFIYANRHIYITEDERKMTEKDVAEVKRHLSGIGNLKYFNFLVTRIVPDKYLRLNQLDRLLLTAMGPLGYFCAGRVMFTGKIDKSAS